MSMHEKNEIILYQAEDSTQVEVKVEDETVWLSQNQMISLFQRDQSVVSRHINNIFKEGELKKKSNMQKMHISGSDKPVAFYNLNVIISVGYRVKSKQGTQFRIIMEHGTIRTQGENLELITKDGIEELPLEEMGGHAAEMHYFIDCVINNEPVTRCLPSDSALSVAYALGV